MVHNEPTSWCTKTTCDFSEDAPSALWVCAQPDSAGRLIQHPSPSPEQGYRSFISPPLWGKLNRYFSKTVETNVYGGPLWWLLSLQLSSISVEIELSCPTPDAYPKNNLFRIWVIACWFSLSVSAPITPQPAIKWSQMFNLWGLGQIKCAVSWAAQQANLPDSRRPECDTVLWFISSSWTRWRNVTVSGRWQYFSCNSVSLQTPRHVQEPSNVLHLKLTGHVLTLTCTYFNLLGSNHYKSSWACRCTRNQAL